MRAHTGCGPLGRTVQSTRRCSGPVTAALATTTAVILLGIRMLAPVVAPTATVAPTRAVAPFVTVATTRDVDLARAVAPSRGAAPATAIVRSAAPRPSPWPPVVAAPLTPFLLRRLSSLPLPYPCRCRHAH